MVEKELFHYAVMELLDNDTPHCKVGNEGKMGRKNGFLVIGNIKIIHAVRRGERLGMNVQTLRKWLSLNTTGLWMQCHLS